MRFYLAVALSCASVMALQILQSRLFSVVTWYHLSFLTISIAMFGLTLGALRVYKGDEEDQRLHLNWYLRQASVAFGISAIAALAVQICIPIVHTNLKMVLLTLPLVAGVTTIAYYYAGKLVSLCLTRSSLPVGKVYAADLLGASLGCLGALGLMHKMDAPSAIMLVSGVVIANALMFSARQKWQVLLLAAVALFIGFVNAASVKPLLYPHWTKGAYVDQSLIDFEKWNAISRVTVSPALKATPVFLWGPSPKLPQFPPMDYKYLMVDGAAGTPIMHYDGKDSDPLKPLEWDVTNIAHFMPGIESMAIVGVGGGRDLLSALYFGAKRVVALDVNGTQVQLLTQEPYRSYSNLWNQPGVNIYHSEARSWFSRNREQFDAVQIALVDTWVSSASGTFALTENSLYTVDAWLAFMRALNKHGVLTVSRWHTPGAYNDVGRLGSMTVAALLRRGQAEPWKNVFIAYSAHVATAVIGINPLTDAQLDALHKVSEEKGYTIIASPRMAPPYDEINKILHAWNGRELQKATANLPYDLSPPTDDRPFFFNQAHIAKPLEVVRQAFMGSVELQNTRGHAVATVNLYIIILLSLISSVLVLVLPYRGAVKNAPATFVQAGTAYFSLIGFGFMFVEMTLIQIMSLYLGHPVYGLGIVLFSLILSTGLGSALSEKFPINDISRLGGWLIFLACYIELLAYFLGGFLADHASWDLYGRVALCVGLIFPCGLAMGFAFPTGMRLIQKRAEKLTPWFWGINGAAGVVASALSIAISIGWGLSMTLLIGGLCYAALVLPALLMMQETEEEA